MAQCKYIIPRTNKRCKRKAKQGEDYCTIAGHGLVDPESISRSEGLLRKELRFVEEYVVDFNATRAAKRAGYSHHTAGQIGFEVLRRPKVAAAIQARLDALSMSAEEAIKRLSEWGRGSVEPFLSVDEDTLELRLDLSSEEARQALHLIKEIKQDDVIIRKANQNDSSEVIGRSWTLKLHDAKDAVDKILKIHGKYAPSGLDVRMYPPEWDENDLGDPREFVQRKLTDGS